MASELSLIGVELLVADLDRALELFRELLGARLEAVQAAVAVGEGRGVDTAVRKLAAAVATGAVTPAR